MSREGREYRFLGWTYLFILLQLLIFRGRIYYLAPAYPMLFASGAVAIESWIENRARALLGPRRDRVRAPLGARQNRGQAPLGACQNIVPAPLCRSWNWIRPG